MLYLKIDNGLKVIEIDLFIIFTTVDSEESVNFRMNKISLNIRVLLILFMHLN